MILSLQWSLVLIHNQSVFIVPSIQVFHVSKFQFISIKPERSQKIFIIFSYALSMSALSQSGSLFTWLGSSIDIAKIDY